MRSRWLALGLVLLPLAASADTADCRASLQCVKQVADDCRDYRTYLEEQLALAKTLLNQANERIVAQQKQLKESMPVKSGAGPDTPAQTTDPSKWHDPERPVQPGKK